MQRVLPQQAGPREAYFSVPIEVADAAIDSVQRALKHLSSDCINLNISAAGVSTEQLGLSSEQSQLLSYPAMSGSFEYRYESVKEFEGDLIRYAVRLRQGSLSDQQQQVVTEVVDAARSLVYASKTLKDVRHDFAQLITLGSDLALELQQLHAKFLSDFYHLLIPLLFAEHATEYLEEQINVLNELNSQHHAKANALLSEKHDSNQQGMMRLSTLFNLNHELHHYARYMLAAVRKTAPVASTRR